MILVSLLRKELRLLFRSFHGILSTFVLGFAILFLFHFSLEREGNLSPDSLVGIKWSLVFLLSFILIGQSTWEERELGAGRALGIFVSPSLVFLVKSIAVWIVLMIAECFLLLGMSLFFLNVRLEDWMYHFSILPLSTLSLSFLGVSLSGLSASSRMKEVILPLLMVPFSIPLFLYGLNAEFRFIHDSESWGDSVLLMVFFCFFYGGVGALFQELQSEDMDE